MKNNLVKTGLLDQRNRGTKSKREKILISAGSSDELDTWLRVNNIEGSELGRIDLAEFLANTAHMNIEPEERLRQLAIHLELSASLQPGLSGWEALKRIYEYALFLNKNDEHVWISLGISAQEVAETQDNEILKKKLYQYSESAILNAIAINSGCSRAHYSLGYLYYFQDKKQDALREFERALACDNDEKVHSWAQLYKAHCFHDRNSWREALEAYSQVDLSAFTGQISWRVEVLREQVLECTFKLGEESTAEMLLVDILNRYEAEPALARHAMSCSLWSVAQSLSQRYVKRAHAIDAQVGL